MAGDALARHARIVRAQVRISLVAAMQYRWDFVFQGIIALVWVFVAMVPLVVVFDHRPTVAGWTWPEALLVMAFFTAIKALLEGAVSPSLTAVVEHVRRGTLDFLLLKPADAQLLVSVGKLEPWRVLDLVAAGIMAGWAFRAMGRTPDVAGVAQAMLLCAMAILVLYSMWILVVSASFYVVRVDNLSFLFGSILDAGRWPISVFRGVLRLVFTWVVPLALMTTYPAMALLGTLDGGTLVGAVAGGLGFTAVGRMVWMRALRSYTSASS